MMSGSSASSLIIDFFYWVAGGVVMVFAAVTNFMNGKIDKKVSKEVFAQYEKRTEQYEKRNDEQHAYTQNALIEGNKKMDKIVDKLDGKQDK